MRQKLLIAALAIGGVGMIAFGGMRYLAHQAVRDVALRFMQSLTAADAEALVEVSDARLGKKIRRLAALENWKPDVGIVHRAKKVKVDGEHASVAMYSSKAGVRLQSTTLELVRIDNEWRVSGGSFQLGKRWLRFLKEHQKQQDDQLFNGLKEAIEGVDN